MADLHQASSSGEGQPAPSPAAQRVTPSPAHESCHDSPGSKHVSPSPAPSPGMGSLQSGGTKSTAFDLSLSRPTSVPAPPPLPPASSNLYGPVTTPSFSPSQLGGSSATLQQLPPISMVARKILQPSSPVVPFTSAPPYLVGDSALTQSALAASRYIQQTMAGIQLAEASRQWQTELSKENSDIQPMSSSNTGDTSDIQPMSSSSTLLPTSTDSAYQSNIPVMSSDNKLLNMKQSASDAPSAHGKPFSHIPYPVTTGTGLPQPNFTSAPSSYANPDPAETAAASFYPPIPSQQRLSTPLTYDAHSGVREPDMSYPERDVTGHKEGYPSPSPWDLAKSIAAQHLLSMAQGSSHLTPPVGIKDDVQPRLDVVTPTTQPESVSASSGTKISSEDKGQPAYEEFSPISSDPDSEVEDIKSKYAEYEQTLGKQTLSYSLPAMQSLLTKGIGYQPDQLPAQSASQFSADPGTDRSDPEQSTEEVPAVRVKDEPENSRSPEPAVVEPTPDSTRATDDLSTEIASSQIAQEELEPVSAPLPINKRKGRAKKVQQNKAVQQQKLEEIADKLQKKNCPQSNKGSLFCEVCGEEYIMKKLLLAHMSVHVAAGPFECPVCDEQFLERSLFDTHMSLHAGARPFFCLDVGCGRRFVRKQELSLHMKSHKKAIFNCRVCGISFNSGLDLDIHLRQHETKQEWKCDICPKIFNRQSKLKSHVAVEHPDNSWKCSVCAESFRAAVDLAKHEENVHGIQSSVFDQEIDIAVPKPRKRSTPKSTGSKAPAKPKPTGEKTFKCSECDKAFHSNMGLYLHRRVHNMDIVYRCPICDKDFLRKDGLKKHMFVHTGERPFGCEHCDMKFTCSSSKKAHMRAMHNVDDKFRCPECHKQFGKKSYLTKHMYQHTGERPVSCPMCDRRFTCKEVMERHLLIHTGEKPHGCTFCGKSFRQKSVLQTHMRTHTGDRPYKCTLCPKAFITKGNLDSHLKTHGGPDTPPTAPKPRNERRPPPPRNPLYLPTMVALSQMSRKEDSHPKDSAENSTQAASKAVCEQDSAAEKGGMKLLTKPAADSQPATTKSADSTAYPSLAERPGMFQYGYQVPPPPQVTAATLPQDSYSSLPQHNLTQPPPQSAPQSLGTVTGALPTMTSPNSYYMGQVGYGQMWNPQYSTSLNSANYSGSLLQSTAAEIADKAIMSMEAGISGQQGKASDLPADQYQPQPSIAPGLLTTAPASVSAPTTIVPSSVTSSSAQGVSQPSQEKRIILPEIRKFLSKASQKEGGLPFMLKPNLSVRDMDLDMFEICRSTNKSTYVRSGSSTPRNRRSNLKQREQGEDGQKMSKKPYMCTTCNKTFSMKKILMAHMAVHVENAPYYCPLCEIEFADKDVFETHMDTHSGDKPYLCSHLGCGKRFLLKAALAEHMHVHLTDKFQCPVCEDWLSSEKEFVSHMAVHGGGKEWKCDVCDKVFARKSRLTSHKRLMHSKGSDGDSLPKDLFAKYLVRQKGSDFGSYAKRARKNAERTLKNGSQTHECPECGKTFKNSVGYYFHKRIHTRDVIYKCPSCPKEFIRKAGIRQHMRVHTGERPYKCTHCSRSFACQSTMKTHMRALHAIDDKFKCTFCGKQFGKKSYLTRHLYKHTGEKPIKCPVCNMGFYCKEVLKRHSLIHTGEKPFQCTVCGKAFRQKSVLQTHSRTHTGDRPYKCSLCSKGFITKGNLDHHMKVHQPPNPDDPLRPAKPRKPRTRKPKVDKDNMEEPSATMFDSSGDSTMSDQVRDRIRSLVRPISPPSSLAMPMFPTLPNTSQPMSSLPQSYAHPGLAGQGSSGMYISPPPLPTSVVPSQTSNPGTVGDHPGQDNSNQGFSFMDFHSNMQMLAQAAAGSLLQLEQARLQQQQQQPAGSMEQEVNQPQTQDAVPPPVQHQQQASSHLYMMRCSTDSDIPLSPHIPASPQLRKHDHSLGDSQASQNLTAMNSQQPSQQQPPSSPGGYPLSSTSHLYNFPGVSLDTRPTVPGNVQTGASTPVFPQPYYTPQNN